jgi:hypothetical protein
MTNYGDFASLATWMTDRAAGKTPESTSGDPLVVYIEQAIEANEAPKAVETAQEAPAGATGDRTNPVGAAGPPGDLMRIIGQAVAQQTDTNVVDYEREGL